jgi:hypothetical protein
MAFTANGLRDAFEAQGELGFMYWTYASNDPLAEVLKPDYFLMMRDRLRVGDLMLVGTNPRAQGSPWRNRTGEIRRALLMVSAVDRGGAVRVRLVQDYGTPEGEEPAGEAAGTMRGRPDKASGGR